MKLQATQIRPGHRVRIAPSTSYQRVAAVRRGALTVTLTLDDGTVEVVRADRGVTVHRASGRSLS